MSNTDDISDWEVGDLVQHPHYLTAVFRVCQRSIDICKVKIEPVWLPEGLRHPFYDIYLANEILISANEMIVLALAAKE